MNFLADKRPFDVLNNALNNNVLVALKLAKMYDKVATVLPDRGERYLSMDLFNETRKIRATA